MKNKISILILLFIFTIPQVVSAAWWNPLSWKVFSKKQIPPKVEMINTSTTTNSNNISNTATTTNQSAEIEKLQAENEALKKAQNINTIPKINTTQIIKTSTTQITTPPNTTLKDYESVYQNLTVNYTSLRRIIINDNNVVNESNGFNDVGANYTKYLSTLLATVSSDIDELNKLRNITPKPSTTIDNYTSKYNRLINEYTSNKTEYKSYLVQQSISSANEEVKNTILEKQNYVKNINIKIAEMDQLRIQIDTLAGSSLISVLNVANKLDGELLFYSFKYACGVGGSTCSYNYPYDKNNFDDNYYRSSIQAGLKAIVANYRAFLVVELAKNQ
jgi:hypothetical protein